MTSQEGPQGRTRTPRTWEKCSRRQGRTQSGPALGCLPPPKKYTFNLNNPIVQTLPVFIRCMNFLQTVRNFRLQPSSCDHCYHTQPCLALRLPRVLYVRVRGTCHLGPLSPRSDGFMGTAHCAPPVHGLAGRSPPKGLPGRSPPQTEDRRAGPAPGERALSRTRGGLEGGQQQQQQRLARRKAKK